MQISSLVSMQRKPSLKGTSEQTIIVVFIYNENIEKPRGGSGTATTSQAEPPVTKDNDWESLTNVTKGSISDAAAVPDQSP